jgi:hypothetical protein
MKVNLMHKSSPKWEAGEIPSAELLQAVGKMIGSMAQSGILRAADGLRASSQGVRLNFVNGKRTETKGPFTGRNELIAGFIVLQVGSINEAIEWSSRFAAAVGDAEIDIRPLTEPWDIGLGSRPKDLTTYRYMAAYKATSESEAGTAPTPAQRIAIRKVFEEMKRAGVLLSTTALEPSSKGVRMKFVRDEQFVMDGPFTESKELIAGFVTIEVPSMQEALVWAPRYAAAVGDIELDVRPLREEW